ncbi:peptidoglycan DD-metalloendopeptidase family protein [Rhodoplanes sp. TEM]|uniref:Peptidoglycan DD-metalloendopeptidase family protein n=1 Tax=Rhodoplanes tepidamans TaxID=200616 RepID=A0ABT5J3T3_RHOTP|nr:MULTISPECIES: peptidoglycan DD-metalloendopeptidase family protein [Rhodoplanes]MDC7784300.1 peptidoglycan DD-metalloendopeptidase family protein [Rhodoplanes tepidamans]MDC7983692.1 peptidoglycan DD-metalloendopeptidase family protein [Rhodoplanes sp. TEM]MDQ0353702.1 septal ring factor EnvC (AmiA/AmiB activator) [Rhodoplanes tepidamans]
MTPSLPSRPAHAALSLALALACAVAPAAPVAAQSERARGPATLDTIRQRDQELEAIKAEQKRAADTEKALRTEIDRLGEDRRKLNQTMIDTAARVRGAEQAIAAIEARLDLLESTEHGINGSLEGRRAVIAQVLAALQRLGRRPPPALLVSPEDALRSVRTAILLGAVLPELKTEAEALATDLADLVRVRRESATEHAKRANDLAVLSEERTRLGLLIEERQRRLGEVEKELETARRRALQLALQADNLKDLIARLEQNLDHAARAARAQAERQAATEARRDFAALKDPGRLAPAIAFASAKGTLPLPVNGMRLREFGASDTHGGTEKGLSITARPGAQVTAPCDGWVVYAAPYRSYGQLLILNAGGGYHVLLAGMERITVDLGQFVLTGEPVGTMGSSGPAMASAATGSTQPVLYVEFRKDGLPVDPSPWWATNESEKVRG